jgi:hypothetical protein
MHTTSSTAPREAQTSSGMERRSASTATSGFTARAGRPGVLDSGRSLTDSIIARLRHRMGIHDPVDLIDWDDGTVITICSICDTDSG